MVVRLFKSQYRAERYLPNIPRNRLKIAVGFFFDLFPDCKPDKSDDDEEDKPERFNPFQLIGSVCHYYGFGYDEVVWKRSYQNLVLLNASIPKSKYKAKTESKKEEETNDLTAMIAKQANQSS